MTDAELFRLCQRYGAAALEARRKFLGLLPEVARRGLWRAKGFGSIFHFAAQLAGVSEEQVRNVLNLEKKFENLPILRQQLVRGEVSVNKLVRVAAVVRPENEIFWADQVRNLSQKAVETLVRDEKNFVLQKPKIGDVELRAQLSGQDNVIDVKAGEMESSLVGLKSHTIQRLLELQNKGLDIDQIINQALDVREAEIVAEKEKLGQGVRVKTARGAVVGEVSGVMGRYIPVKIRSILRREHGGRCVVPVCKKPARVIHHALRFAMVRGHDPRFLLPLCWEHHEITHKIDGRFLKYAGGGSGQMSL